jgi:hypothetical protein
LCNFFPKSGVHSIEKGHQQNMIFTSKNLSQKTGLVGGLVAEEENMHHDVVRSIVSKRVEKINDNQQCAARMKILQKVEGWSSEKDHARLM